MVIDHHVASVSATSADPKGKTMRPLFILGMAAIMAALFIIFDRTALAGRTITQGEVAVTERDETKEERLFVVGGVLGGLGIVTLIVAVLGTRSSGPRPKPP
jgi:hypothetical protein